MHRRLCDRSSLAKLAVMLRPRLAHVELPMAARHEVLRPSTEMTRLTALDGLALKERLAVYMVVVFSQQVTDHGVMNKYNCI